MTRVLILLLLLIGVGLKAQTPNDPIPKSGFNEKYLEHLIKITVDSVRLAHKLEPLVNDSILYVAADDHSLYLKEKNLTSHYQDRNKLKKTPQLRAEFYGAENYLVGENIAKTYIHKKMRDRKGNSYQLTTYQQVASKFAQMWVNSPRHYENIIAEDYQVTGLSISYDAETGTIRAVQKFAQVLYKYEFKENKEFFSYSNYLPKAPVTSFDEVSSERKFEKYAYNIKTPEDSVEECSFCNSVIDTNVYNDKLMIKGSRIVFQTYNTEMMLALLNHRKNGLVIEVVEYEPIDCGNEEFYTKPSRRNNQSALNGFLLEPKYRKDLKKGFKRNPYKWWFRIKKKKQISHFELSLGRLPRKLNGYVEVNLIVLQKNKICRVRHFSDVCGEELNELYDIPYLSKLNTYQYSVNPEVSTVEFKVPFEQGKYAYKYEDIKELLESYTSSEFTVEDIEVYAFSSLEGSEEINLRLQKMRARSIITALEQKQRSTINAKVEATENWELFLKQIEENDELEMLRDLSKSEIKSKLSNLEFVEEIEPFLAEQRYAFIRMRVKTELNKSGLGKVLLADFNRFKDSISEQLKYQGYTSTVKANLDTLAGIQWYAYRLIKQGQVDTSIFAQFAVPMKIDYANIIKDHLWYDMDIHGSGEGNPQWEAQFYLQINQLDRLGISSFEIRYDVMNYLVRNWTKKPPFRGDFEKLQLGIEGLIQTAPSDTLKMYSQRLLDNFHTQFCAYVMTKNGDYEQLRESLEFLHDKYLNSDLEIDKLYPLALFMTFCEQHDLAYNLLNERIKNGEDHAPSLILHAKLIFSHFEEWGGDKSYSNQLIDLRSKLSQKEWCEMFVGPCNISFQVFDDEELRNFYCSECANRKNYAEKPEEWELSN
jgi:uncharacterized protein YkwD